MEDRKICKVRHAKALRYCAKGCRAFFKAHGLDWIEFVRNGYEPEVLLKTNDLMATRLVDLALAEQKGDK